MTTAVVEAARAADSQSPWPGLAAFEEGDGAFFKGREEAIATLARLIAREDLTLLWGFSGLGKTSLLRAGLFPRLREADIFPVYVRLRYARSGADGPEPASLVGQCFDQMRLAADCWKFEIPEPAPSGTMWEYVRRRDHQFWGPGDRLVTPLLVFDQFEELFTPDRARELTAETIDAFFHDISQAVSGCPPQWLLDAGRTTTEDGDYVYRPGALKVLLSFREDYLAQVTGLKTLVEAIDGNHYRLVSMTVEEAVTAVFQAGGHLIEGATAEDRLPTCREIVARVTSAAPGPHQSATVDPAFLSLFCRRLNEQRLHDGRPVIDRELVLGAEASQIISNFYNTSMVQVSEATRRFVESSLVLAESRSRDSAAEVLALRSGATREDLDFLVNAKRILRREQNTRFGQTRLELTHDILVEPALAARERREVEERRAEQERARAAQVQREHDAADRQRQAREIELLRQRVALEERLEAERKRGDEQTAARLEAERQREALEAAERERRLAEAVRTVRRRKRVVTWGLSALLVVVVAGWFAVDRVRTLQEQQRRLATYLERAVDDAASARPAQALARLAAVMREQPDHTVARSLALDLLLRRTWLLPVATSSLARGHTLTAFNSDGDWSPRCRTPARCMSGRPRPERQRDPRASMARRCRSCASRRRSPTGSSPWRRTGSRESGPRGAARRSPRSARRRRLPQPPSAPCRWPTGRRPMPSSRPPPRMGGSSSGASIGASRRANCIGSSSSPLPASSSSARMASDCWRLPVPRSRFRDSDVSQADSRPPRADRDS